MKALNFEKAIGELESLIAQLEKGDLSLEQSIKLYENGVKLTAFCNDELKNAKLTIEELQEHKQAQEEKSDD